MGIGQFTDEDDVQIKGPSGDIAVVSASGELSVVASGSVRIEGATDSTQIGNVGNRLKVDALSSVSPVPSANVIYKQVMLLNGSVFNANVNGSVTPVNYDFTPSSGEIWYLDKVSCILGDPGTPDFSEFASLGSALTNGCDLLVRSGGTEYNICNIKENAGMQLAFSEHNYFPTNLGWLNEVDMFSGTMQFSPPIKLDNTTSDYIRFRIRDNLTGVLFLVLSIKAWRVI